MLSDEKIDFALECAKEAAKIGGKVIKEYYSGGYKYEMKGLSDWVTEADRESEKKIKDFLRENLPFDFLGEEFGEEKIVEGKAESKADSIQRKNLNSTSGEEGKVQNNIRWLIDPLDGTKNFMKKIPFFCVSIALCEGNNPVVGVVFSPLDENMFWAVQGKGAYLNGKKIKVSDTSDFHSAMLGTGLPFRSRQFIDLYIKSFEEFFMRGASIRNLGSAALELCLVASGELDGFWELGLSPWDMAAASLIIKEAGGKVSDFWGGDSWMDTGCILASNSHLFDEMLKVTSEVFKKL